MTKHQEGTCATCKYYRKIDNTPLSGECHRSAPRAGFFQNVVAPCDGVVAADFAATVVWPEVDGDDGCGEWERER